MLLSSRKEQLGPAEKGLYSLGVYYVQESTTGILIYMVWIYTISLKASFFVTLFEGRTTWPCLERRVQSRLILCLWVGVYHHYSYVYGPGYYDGTVLNKVIQSVSKSYNLGPRGSIFNRVRPFYERAVSDLDPLRSMHRPV